MPAQWPPSFLPEDGDVVGCLGVVVIVFVVFIIMATLGTIF